MTGRENQELLNAKYKTGSTKLMKRSHGEMPLLFGGSGEVTFMLRPEEYTASAKSKPGVVQMRILQEGRKLKDKQTLEAFPSPSFPKTCCLTLSLTRTCSKSLPSFISPGTSISFLLSPWNSKGPSFSATCPEPILLWITSTSVTF